MTIDDIFAEEWAQNLQGTEEQRKLLAIRLWRTQRLFDSDWTQLVDTELPNKTEWAAYRQSLRDLPSNYSLGMELPTEPEN